MPWKKYQLRLVKEEEAEGETSRIYMEVKQLLGLPTVNKVFQSLASYPKFFSVFWEAADPMLRTNEFFSAANRLGAEAYTRVHNYFSVPDLRFKVEEMHFSSGAQEELRAEIELYHYNYPVLLLLCAALMQAFENPGIEPRSQATPALRREIPRRPILVEEERAPAPTRRIYDDVKRTLGAPFLNTCYLTFGRWPDFLREYWNALKPVITGPIYEQHRRAIQESALSLAAELPEPLQLSQHEMTEAGVRESELAAIVQFTDSFIHLLSKQVLNLAFAKIGLEGGVRSTAAA